MIKLQNLNTEMEFKSDDIEKNLKKLTNQIYKILPYQEEKKDWEPLLDTIIEEINGMSVLISGQGNLFFSLICKLQGLKMLTAEENFKLFRRTIFECLNLISIIRRNICKG